MDVAKLVEKWEGGQYWAAACTILLSNHPNNGFNEWNNLPKESNADLLSTVSLIFKLKI